MSSSKIEGEQMEVDSYVKHQLLNTEYLPELKRKPYDLFNAYLFAKAHQYIIEHLLPQHQRGVFRKTEMLVMEHQTVRIQYEAAPANILAIEYQIF